MERIHRMLSAHLTDTNGIQWTLFGFHLLRQSSMGSVICTLILHYRITAEYKIDTKRSGNGWVPDKTDKTDSNLRRTVWWDPLLVLNMLKLSCRTSTTTEYSPYRNSTLTYSNRLCSVTIRFTDPVRCDRGLNKRC